MSSVTRFASGWPCTRYRLFALARRSAVAACIGGDHALLDQPVRVVAQYRIEALDPAVLADARLDLAAAKIQRAEQKVSAVVNEMEKSLAGAVPGFKLDPPAYPPLPAAPPLAHPQFQLTEPSTEMVRTESQEMSGLAGKLGFCPNCTSTNVRRANRQGLFEEFLRLFFVAPFRCRACRHKFYRF